MTDINTGRDESCEIDSQAAAWAARKLSGAYSKRDESSLNSWLDADPRHAIALAEYLSIAEASALAGAAGGKQQFANDDSVDANRKRRRGLLIGAPALAASLAAGLFFVATIQQSPTKTDRFATAFGETRDVSLPDGSMATLNTDTILTFSDERGERHARVERGEVFFDVAHDETRPFVVVTGDARATVLGTSFTVDRRDGKSIVSVLSGTVEVSPLTETETPSQLRLEAGQMVAVASTGAISAINTFETDIAATWRHGYLHFSQTPLEDVVSDLNRYFSPQITLGDPKLGAAPVSGRIELDDQEVAIRAISVALSLEADRSSAGAIILRADE